MPQTSRRFGVLTIVLPSTQHGYVIVDTQTGRITDGVYAVRAMALDVAAASEIAGPPTDMTPPAEALGLRFPSRRRPNR